MKLHERHVMINKIANDFPYQCGYATPNNSFLHSEETVLLLDDPFL